MVYGMKLLCNSYNMSSYLYLHAMYVGHHANSRDCQFLTIQHPSKIGPCMLAMFELIQHDWTNHKKYATLCSIPPTPYNTPPTMIAIFLPAKSEKARDNNAVENMHIFSLLCIYSSLPATSAPAKHPTDKTATMSPWNRVRESQLCIEVKTMYIAWLCTS